MNTIVRLKNYRSAYMFQNNLVPTAPANKSLYSHLMGLFARSNYPLFPGTEGRALMRYQKTAALFR